MENKALMRARSVLIVLALFIIESDVLAQGSPLTQRQAEILREVGSVNGSLSRAQYDEFWAGFRSLSAAERERLRMSFRSELPAVLKYQRTLWLAARESLKQRRPVITPELHKEFEQAERKDRESNPRQNRSTEMKRTAQALLEGAAHQAPVNKDGRTFPEDGRSFQITPEVIAQVLRGLDGSINRLERLFSESWCMYPDVDGRVRIAEAKKAISAYRKAANDRTGEIDLIIHFVECGNQFTLDFGDIDEKFYDSLLSMYAGAVKAVAELPDSEQKPFRQRLWKLTESSDGIGWGYHDGLCDEYYSAFPERDA